MKPARERGVSYRKMVQTVPDVLYEIGNDGKFIFISEAVRIFGYEPGLLIGKDFTCIIHPDDIPRISRKDVLPAFKGKNIGEGKAPKLFDERRTESRMTKNLETRIVPGPAEKKKRDFFYVEVHSSGVWGGGKSDKGLKGALGIFRDITHRKFFEQELVRKCGDLSRMVENDPDGLMVINKANEILFMNSAAREFCHGETVHLTSEIKKARHGDDTPVEIEIEDATGGRRVLGMLATCINWEGQECYLVSLRDETENCKVRDVFCEASMRDELTGLYNRRAFMVLAHQQIKSSKRRDENMYVLFADMDGLKGINDRYGHAEGDKALVDVADSMRAVFRESDIIARIAGDEFVVMGVVLKKEDVAMTRKRLLAHIAFLNDMRSSPPKISLSIGEICLTPDDATEIGHLLEEADRMMYIDKKRDKIA